MPRYDYQCAGCGLIEEHDRAVADRHQAPACTRCGGPTTLCVSAPLVVFRGTGWTTPTTTDQLRRRSAEHAARGHQLPLRARKTR